MEVVTLASKRSLSQTSDAEDVAYQLDAFQSLNSCILSVCFEVTPRRGLPSLVMILTAFEVDTKTLARKQLALSRFSLSQLGYKQLAPAITYALYQIDAQLAARELLAPQTG